MKTVLFVQYNPESPDEASAIISLMEQFPEASKPMEDPFWSDQPDMFDSCYVPSHEINEIVNRVKRLAVIYNKKFGTPAVLNVGAYFELVEPKE